MTDIIDRANSGDIPARFEQRTYNLAAKRLRDAESPLRSTLYGPSPAAETMILDNTGSPYRCKPPVFTALGHRPFGADAWVFDLFGELQEPPTGNPPPLRPTPPAPAKAERRVRFRHRRRLDRLVKGVLIGAGAVTAALLGVDLAALLVMGWFG